MEVDVGRVILSACILLLNVNDAVTQQDTVCIDTDQPFGSCCKGAKYIDRKEARYFTCKTEGGCCGELDAEYCCDKQNIQLQLGFGLTFGTLAVLAILCFIMYCVVKCHYGAQGQEVYCDGCCVCKVRNKANPVYGLDGVPVPVQTQYHVYNQELETGSEDRTSMTSQQPYPSPELFTTYSLYTRDDEPRRNNRSRGDSPRNYPTSDLFATVVALPTAPPVTEPEANDDLPSYNDVVNNPSTFPRTKPLQPDDTIYI